MEAALTSKISKSAVRKAGSVIRAYARGQGSEKQFRDAMALTKKYRTLFARPMDRVNQRLTTLAHHVDAQAEVTSRLKRAQTMVDKLSREPGMDLSRMHDIAGCRAVVGKIDLLQELRAEVNASWGQDVITVRDYVMTPRQSGYRAIHIVVREEARPVEIQLRTISMHRWAESVESFSNLLGDNFKHDGNHVVQQYLRAYSEVTWAVDSDQEVTQKARATMRELIPMIQSLVDQAIAGTSEEG